MLYHLLMQTVATDPDRVALISGARRLTYGQLRDEVLRMAARLEAGGVRGQGCVALALENSLEWVIGFFAAARARATILLLDPLAQEYELDRAFREVQPQVLITDRRRRAIIEAIAEKVCPLALLVAVDDSGRQGLDATEPPDETHSSTPYGGPFLIQYSSGSMGRPKRVVRSQANLCAEADQFARTTSTSPADRILCMLPLFHAHGLGNCLLATVRCGGTLSLLEPVRPGVGQHDVPFTARCQAVAEYVQQDRTTVLPGVPYQFQALVEAPGIPSDAFQSLRLAISAGSGLPRAAYERFLARFGVPVRQLYGCTEAGSVTINLSSLDGLDPDSVGCPMLGVDVKIVGEAAESVPVGQVGEVALHSPALAAGYTDAPQATRDSFRQGWFFTGDRGVIDLEGRLFLVGRKAAFIEVAGRKVDPFEVEEFLRNCPGVREAVVVGQPTADGQEEVKAVIVPEAGCREADILAYCDSRIAAYKIPRRIEFRDEIPRSPLGKILRKHLVEPTRPASRFPEWLQEQRGNGRPIGPVLEAWLMEQVRTVLRATETVLTKETLWGELGLDSVLAVELTTRLGSELGQSISPTLLWSYPSVASLTGYLERTFSTGPETAGAPPKVGSPADVAAMSEEQAERQLEAELDDLKRQSRKL